MNGLLTVAALVLSAYWLSAQTSELCPDTLAEVVALTPVRTLA